MKRLPLLLAICLQASAFAQTHNLIIGTYAKPSEDGIQVFQYDEHTAATSKKSSVSGIENPSFLTLSADKRFLYSVTETHGPEKGGVYSFHFKPATGALSFINKQSSEGNDPCYVATDKAGRFVYVGNYSSGNLAVLPVTASGSLESANQVIAHAGNPGEARKGKSNVHQTILSPDEKYLLVNNLGTDKLYVYPRSSKYHQSLNIDGVKEIALTPGGGPRHLTFHPKKPWMYVLQELNSSVTALKFKKGTLNTFQTVSLLKPNYTGKAGAADIHISPDGMFLYASDRGDVNELIIYSIDQKTGALTQIGRQSVLGKTPRNFAIDPSGKHLLVANQNSDEVVIFNRDIKTGLLTDSGKRIAVSKPVCLIFSSL